MDYYHPGAHCDRNKVLNKLAGVNESTGVRAKLSRKSIQSPCARACEIWSFFKIYSRLCQRHPLRTARSRVNVSSLPGG